MTKIKYALVLSGGGFKGAFQIGALNYIRKNWRKITGEEGEMHFDIVAGVSVGALNGSLIAMNKVDALNSIWQQIAEEGPGMIYNSDFIEIKNQSEKVAFKLDLPVIQKRLFPNFEIKVNAFKGLAMLLSKKKRKEFLYQLLDTAGEEIKENIANFKSLADNTALKKLLTEHLDLEAIKNCRFLSGFVSLENGNYYGIVHTEYKNNSEFVNGVLASTTIPTIWEPVEKVILKNKTIKHSVDGGIRNISPLGDVINEINKDQQGDIDYRIIIINCSNGYVELHENPDKMNIVEIGIRSLNDIALTEIFNNDIEQFLRINDLIKQMREKGIDIPLRNYDFQIGQRTTGFLKPYLSVIVQPEGSLGDSLSANKPLIEQRMLLGERMAETAFQRGLDSFVLS